MTRCTKCGTGWTSSGLPLCPICGTKVPASVAASAPVPVPDPVPLIEMPAAEPVPRKNGTALLEAPPEARKPRTEFRPEPPPPAKKETVVLRPPEPAAEEKPVEAESRLRLLDPSAADLPAQKELPLPARPLIAPLIFGSLAFVPALLVPLTMGFESTRVLGVLGFCMSGFFAPFAPIAWMVGLSAEQRRRDQRLRPEPAVTLGRKLGQIATLVLVGEMTVFLIAIAALRLSGSFPHTFWSVF